MGHGARWAMGPDGPWADGHGARWAMGPDGQWGQMGHGARWAMGPDGDGATSSKLYSISVIVHYNI